MDALSRQSSDVIVATYNMQYGYGNRKVQQWHHNHRDDDDLLASALNVLAGRNHTLDNADLAAELPESWVLGLAEHYVPDGEEGLAPQIARFLEHKGISCNFHTVTLQEGRERRHFHSEEQKQVETGDFGLVLLTNLEVKKWAELPLAGSRYPHKAMEAVVDCGGHDLRMLMAHLNVNPLVSHGQVLGLLDEVADSETHTVAMGDWNYPQRFLWWGAERLASQRGLRYAKYQGGSFPEGCFVPPFPDGIPRVGIRQRIREGKTPLMMDVQASPWRWLEHLVAIDHIVGKDVAFSGVQSLATGSDHRAVRAVSQLLPA